MFYEKIVSKYNKINFVLLILFLLVGSFVNASQEEGDKTFITPQEAKEAMPFVSAACDVERESDKDTYLKSKGLGELNFDLKGIGGKEILDNMKEEIQRLRDNGPDAVEESDLKFMNCAVKNLKIDPSNESVLVDTNTGLRFTLLQHADQYILAFGSMDSDRQSNSEYFMRMGAYLLPDWGWFNKIYQQAVGVAKILKFVYPKNIITTTGHSLGGALAIVAAGENGLTAKAFNPIALESSMAKKIEYNSLNIEIFMVENDFWSDRNWFGEHIGKKHYVKSIDGGDKHSDSWYFIVNVINPGIVEENQFEEWSEKTKILREEYLENFERRNGTKIEEHEVDAEELVDTEAIVEDTETSPETLLVPIEPVEVNEVDAETLEEEDEREEWKKQFDNWLQLTKAERLRSENKWYVDLKSDTRHKWLFDEIKVRRLTKMDCMFISQYLRKNKATEELLDGIRGLISEM